MYPFEFKIKMSRRERARRRMILAVSYVILAAWFLGGFLNVYANCYNSMNPEPLTVFDLEKTEEGITATILGEEFVIIHF